MNKSKNNVNSRHGFAAFFGMVLFSVFLAACSTGGTGNKPVATTSDSAVFLGGFSGVNFIDDLKARFTNMSETVSADTKIVVISGDYPNTSNELKAAADAYQNGAVIVLARPTGAQHGALVAVMEHQSVLEHNTGNNVECDLYAFNKFDDHHILNMSLQPEAGGGTSKDGSVDENGVVTEGDEQAETPDTGEAAAADPAPFLDIMVEWITEHDKGVKGGSSERNARAAADDVNNLINAQHVNYSYVAGSNVKRPDGTKCNNIAATDVFNIWAVYDMTGKNDYYIVKEEVMIPNSGLGYVQDKAKGSGKGHYQMTSYYLHSFENENKPQKNGADLTYPNAVLINPSPQTVNGASTVITSDSWSLNGAIGFNGLGGTGSIGGGVSHTDSQTRTVQDFSVANKSNNPAASWTYKIANHPEVTEKPSVFYPYTVHIGGAPSLAKNTALFTNMWIWQIKNTQAGDVYQMHTNSAVWIEDAWVQSTGTYEWTTHRSWAAAPVSNVFNLTPPPRDLAKLTLTNNSQFYISKVEVWKPSTPTTKNADYVSTQTIPNTGNNSLEIPFPIGNGCKMRLTTPSGQFRSKDGGFELPLTGRTVYLNPGSSPDFVQGDF